MSAIASTLKLLFTCFANSQNKHRRHNKHRGNNGLMAPRSLYAAATFIYILCVKEGKACCDCVWASLSAQSRGTEGETQSWQFSETPPPKSQRHSSLCSFCCHINGPCVIHICAERACYSMKTACGEVPLRILYSPLAAVSSILLMALCCMSSVTLLPTLPAFFSAIYVKIVTLKRAFIQLA